MAMCLLFPAISALEDVPDNTGTPQVDDSLSDQPDVAEITEESEIRGLCPSILEMPLMLGKPAPCMATYSLF